MQMPVDFDLMMDGLIDNGYFEHVDDAIKDMLKKSFDAGFVAGRHKAIVVLAAKGMLHIEVNSKTDCRDSEKHPSALGHSLKNPE